MSRLGRMNSLLRPVLMLVAIPLAISGTGYALFSQQLSVNASASKPAYSATQNLSLSYTKSTSPQGQNFNYTVNLTLQYNGTGTIESWQVLFDLPSDFSQFGCSASVSCSTTGVTATILNGSGNGTINPGGTVNFTVTFKTSDPAYSLQNMNISGVLARVWQTLPGLTATAVAGTRTKSGKWYSWPYTFTVTNNSGQTITAWRIVAPWSTSTNRVNSMAGTVTYVESATNITIVRSATMNSGTNFQFTGNLGSTNQNYSFTGYTVEGAL